MSVDVIVARALQYGCVTDWCFLSREKKSNTLLKRTLRWLLRTFRNLPRMLRKFPRTLRKLPPS
jgi:hypothetical protein